MSLSVSRGRVAEPPSTRAAPVNRWRATVPSSDPEGVEGLAAQFEEQGFVKVEQAFPTAVATQCREILWADVRRQVPTIDPADPSTWSQPVVWLGDHAEPPFGAAANTERLHATYDALVGPGRWTPRASLGSFPVRFPAEASSGDDGWHVDASFRGDAAEGDYFRYRVNLASKGRALLMLFLFSDVGEEDAPTRIRVGSHRDVARLLAPAGADGLEMLALSTAAAEATAGLPEVSATGRAGDVYLCHPFLVHAAQRNRGRSPRFLAQPPLHPAPQRE